MKGERAYLLLLGLAAAALLIAAVERSLTPAPAAIVVSTPAPEFLGTVPDFTLADSHGAAVHRADLRGPYIADFIFTRCSGQCPMITERFRQIQQNLPGVRLISFSVDPADTAEDLRQYKRENKADWPFLWGKDMASLIKNGFKLPVADGGPVNEPITHARTVVLVDADNRIRGYYDPEDISAVAALETRYRGLMGKGD
jgi:protein SCO1/2